VLKNAPILILDEVTSSVYAQTELRIQKALERLSTIRSADKIMALEENRVRESGPRDEWMKLEDGLYRKLHNSPRQLEPIAHGLN
jgi:ABC-type multidrug transport system fused ATPase/permease subunit